MRTRGRRTHRTAWACQWSHGRQTPARCAEHAPPERPGHPLFHPADVPVLAIPPAWPESWPTPRRCKPDQAVAGLGTLRTEFDPRQHRGVGCSGNGISWTHGPAAELTVQHLEPACSSIPTGPGFREPTRFGIRLDRTPGPEPWRCSGTPLRRREASTAAGAPRSVGPPLLPVPATDAREVAMTWYQVLQEQGIEGVVAERGVLPWRRPGRAGPDGGRGAVPVCG